MTDNYAAQRARLAELADVISDCADLLRDARRLLREMNDAGITYARHTTGEQADLWAAVLELQTAGADMFHEAKRSVGHAVTTGHSIVTTDGYREFRLVGPPRAFGPIQIAEVRR